MMIAALAGATIVVPDLDAAIAAYGTFLDYRGEAPAPVGAAQAAAWGLPKAADARMAVLRPASGEARFIRLVEGRSDVPFAPLKTAGWSAVEIVVRDLHALAARLAGSPFRIIGPPARLDFDFTDALSAMQVVGSGGEILYFTQIDGDIPGFDLPCAGAAVGQMFIMVMGATDLAATGAFYADLGRPVGPVLQARIDILSDARGLARDHRHSLTTITLGDRSLIEVDAYPADTPTRPVTAIGLPCGIAMASFHAASSSAAADAILVGAAGEWIEVLDRA